MKAEELLDHMEGQLKKALACYDKALACCSDPDIETKKRYTEQMLDFVRGLKGKHRFLPRASRFKQVSEIAMDMEIEAAKERNAKLWKEIEQLRLDREQTKVKYANHYAQDVCGGDDEYAATNYISGWNDADFTMMGKLKTLLDELRGNMINDDVIETIIKKLTK